MSHSVQMDSLIRTTTSVTRVQGGIKVSAVIVGTFPYIAPQTSSRFTYHPKTDITGGQTLPMGKLGGVQHCTNNTSAFLETGLTM